jgi:hypothetical protein
MTCGRGGRHCCPDERDR